jgi:hypothetical protein
MKPNKEEPMKKKTTAILTAALLLVSTAAYAAKPGHTPGKGPVKKNPPFQEPDLRERDCTPVLVPSGDGVRREQSDLKRECAIASDNLWCWGRNDEGQVGNGDPGPNCEAVSATDPALVLVGGVTEFAIEQVGDFAMHTCAIQHGQVLCWGANNLGALGNVDEPHLEVANRSTPRIAAKISTGGTFATSIRIGGTWSCADIAGVAVCAGYDGTWH